MAGTSAKIEVDIPRDQIKEIVDNQIRYTELPLAQLREHPDNPRRRFDAAKLKELAESIGAQGVIQPLVVRPQPHCSDTYQIVCGARRYRAAQLAGDIATVPVRIKQLSDAQTLEIMVVENLQREDVHPLDEAIGFQRLLDSGLYYSCQGIAEKVGKSPEYVAKRLALQKACEEVRVALEDDKIGLGHALLLARLEEKYQKEALKKATEWKLYTVPQLAAHIASTYLLRLSEAPFDLKDTGLLKKAGSCVACPKRTGARAELFPEVGKQQDSCTAPACYYGKVKAMLDAKRKQFEIAGEELVDLLGDSYWGGKIKYPPNAIGPHHYKVIAPGEKECKHVKSGLICAGKGQGTVVRICATKGCKSHFPGQVEPEKMARDYQAENAERNLRVSRLNQRVRAAILAKLTVPWGPAEFLFIARQVGDPNMDLMEARLTEIHGAEWLAEANWGESEAAMHEYFASLEPDALCRLIQELLLETFCFNDSPENDAPRLAASLGVDVDAIGAQVIAEREAELAAAKPKTDPASGQPGC